MTECFKVSENKNAMYLNLHMAARAVVEGKFIAWDEEGQSNKEEEKFLDSNNPSTHFKAWATEEHVKPNK